MKIAVLTSEYITEVNWHGGLANYLSRIVEGLIKKGHEVHIFVYSNVQEIERKENGLVIHRIAFSEKRLWLFNIATLRLFPGFALIVYIVYKFRRYFLGINKKEKFDIIHSSSCQAPALFLNSRRIGLPIVTRFSSVMKLCQVAYNRKNKIDMFLINWAEKTLAKRSDKVFAPSFLVKNKIKEEFGIDIDVIESPEYFREIKELDCSIYDKYFKGKKYVLFYGTLGRLKGSEFIAEIIYDFLATYQDYYFVIIGKMEILQKRRLPIEPILENAQEHRQRIIYLNSLVHSRLLPIINSARAVFLPSMIDNLPNTCIEAMSQGKIVVGTYDGGFDQLIADGENGFLVNYGDCDRLHEIFNKICRGNKDDLARIEERAKETIKKKLNFEKKITELEGCYQQAIDSYKQKYGQKK